MVSARVFRLFAFSSLLLPVAPLLAQQTGAINGTVKATDGSALPGVAVEARSNVLPQPRATVPAAPAPTG